MADQQDFIYDYSNDAIFTDPIASTARHYSTLNISEMVQDRDIVTTEKY